MTSHSKTKPYQN